MWNEKSASHICFSIKERNSGSSLRSWKSDFPDNSNLITGIVLEFAVPTAVVSLMWVTIYSGNNAMSLALVVIDTVLAPFLIPATLHVMVGSRVQIDVTQMMLQLILWWHCRRFWR